MKLDDRQLRKIAIQKANQSLCRYKVSALGFNKKGEVIYKAMNIPRFLREGGSKHAEMEVMLKGGPGIHQILICRTNGNGDILPIHPCKTCAKKANELGIKIISINCEC